MLEVVLFGIHGRVLETAGGFWKAIRGLWLLFWEINGDVIEMTLQKQDLMKLMLFYLA